MNSWSGKLLRVNLTQETWTVEDIDSQMARDYIGGRGLGTRILCNEINPEIDPLDPDNKLIFMAGPLTGTGAPCGARYMVITKSPLTGAIACSNSGGYFPAELKSAGYDGIIFEGAADKPVYLNIEDDKIEILPAENLWGKTTHETEDCIRARINNPDIAKKTRIASIGPAGEKLSKIACIINDKQRAAGRSGVGAVMGSKNLKAVAIRGTKGRQIHNPDKFKKAIKIGMERIKVGPVTSEGLPTYGTSVLVNIINECGILPTHNFQKGMFEDATKISGEAIKENILVSNKGCFACPISCGRLTKIDNPEFSGQGEGPEYETVELMGANCGINDLAPITKANYLCNELGMDTISAACTVATAMELYEKKALTKEETGIDLRFGNGKALVKLIEQMGLRKGFGDVAADGSYVLAEKYGHPELFMGVKKQEIPAYDPRGVQGMGLTYATSNRGACHVRSYTIANEILGIHEKIDPQATEGKAAVVKVSQDLTALIDASGLCLFLALTPNFAYDEIGEMISAVTGFDFTPEELQKAAERIWNLERMFNHKAGLTKDDDSLPERLLKEPLSEGGPRGQVCRLDEMLPEYYQLRGWNKRGVPTEEKLAELGL